MTTAYTCPRGCCAVRLGTAVARGAERDIYVNGERGTYTTTAKRFGLSHMGVYHRIESGHCLRETSAEIRARRVRKRVERHVRKPSSLVNQFLRALPAPPRTP